MNCPTCQIELDKHPAGRCLDGWVAELILGCKRDNVWGEDFFVLPPQGIPCGFVLPYAGRVGFSYVAPEVSTRWDQAWQLFELLIMQIACAGSSAPPTGFYAGYGADSGLFNPDNPCAAFDIDPKVAICKAAIKIQAARIEDSNNE